MVPNPNPISRHLGAPTLSQSDKSTWQILAGERRERRSRRLQLSRSLLSNLGLSMSRNVVRRLTINKLLRPALPRGQRSLHSSAPCHFAAALGQAVDVQEVPKVVETPLAKLKRRKLRDLEAVLRQERPDPAHVWACYIDLLGVAMPAEVPLEMHQGVLRKSTLPPADSRKDLYRRLAAKKRPRAPHVHESRYQNIINNIQEAGYTPSAEDYEFILEQFAAVGHQVGAIQVLQEMAHLGLERTHKTYGLCLMAIAHRLTLPIWHGDKEALIDTMTRICLKLINEMSENRVPMTAFNLDLTMRILKETLDFEAFARLLRISYGIDLSYPDRPPLEFWDKPADGASIAGASLQIPLQPQPFSSSALNSTLDFLGRLGNVSKLIQAFEVLTTPLPPHAAAPESAYADDADEDFGVNRPSVASFTPPHALPNTMSYSLMIKWLSRAGHPALARHYLVQAMEWDRLVDRDLRGQCLLKRPEEIISPRFGISQYFFLPILGEANRNKSIELMRFVHRKLQRQLRRKRVDIAFYSEILAQWNEEARLKAAEEEAQRYADDEAIINAAAASEQPGSPTDAKDSVITSTTTSVSELPVASTSSTLPSRSLSSSSSSRAASSSEPLVEVPFEPVPEPTPAKPRTPKQFNIRLHLSILERDKRQIEDLEVRVRDTLGRSVQRVKERLGRRIWGNKNVWLQSEGTRTRLSRTTWREIVHFKPTRALDEITEDELIVGGRRRRRPRVAPGYVAAQQGFFTPSSPWADRLRQPADTSASEGTSTEADASSS